MNVANIIITKSKHHIVVGDHEDIKKDLEHDHRYCMNVANIIITASVERVMVASKLVIK